MTTFGTVKDGRDTKNCQSDKVFSQRVMNAQIGKFVSLRTSITILIYGLFMIPG